MLGWVAVLTVAAFPVAEAARIILQRSHVPFYGDLALTDLATRHAWHLQQLLGPYSRYGFHDLGPAMYYALAPFERLLQGGAGVYLGSVVLNGATLVISVAVLWRRAGAVVALWASGAISVFTICVGVGLFREPWNPYLVVAPMVLFVVLWSVAATGMRGVTAWTLVVGSYEIQTHIATAGFVVVMSVLLLAWLAFHTVCRRGIRWAPERFRHPGSLTGVLALILIWIPPLIDIFHDHPNNVTAVWDFFTSSHPGPTLGQAIRSSADAISIVPFGNRLYVTTLMRSHLELGVAAAGLTAGLIVSVWIGWRRRQPLAIALAATAVGGVVLGAISLWRTAGPILFYFTVWLAFVPLSVLLAIGVACLAPRGADAPPASEFAHVKRKTPVLLAAACALAAVVAGAGALRNDLQTISIRTLTSPAHSLSLRETERLVQAAESVLQPSDRWVSITIGTPVLWAQAAGMIVDLQERGVQSTVAPASFGLEFDPYATAVRPVQVRFELYQAGDLAAQRAARGRLLTVVDGQVLTYTRQ